ncbi:hypothetical protein HER39_11530, partial [Arthrobacter deserti]|nr:hypothetical protein [Arthrobacter deserti]
PGARRSPAPDGGPTPVYTGGGGYARVYGPDSALLTEPLDPATEGLVYADLDLAQIDLAKNIVDPAGHYARPDVTRLLLDDRPRTAVLRPGQLEGELFAPLPGADSAGEETPSYV